MMNNIKNIRAKLAELQLDAIMLTSHVNRRYATGFPSSAGVVLITADDAHFLVDSRYTEAATAAIADATVTEVNTQDAYYENINRIISTGKLGFEEKSLTYSEYQTYTEKLTAQLLPAQTILSELRASKSREELDYMIAAQRIAEKSLLETLDRFKYEMTERELAAELVFRMQKNGADDKSFDTIVVSGERSSMPHGTPTDNKISKGFLTIDFGAKLNGYCSDTTRTFSVGNPTDEMRKIYDTVLAAQQAGIDAARSGVTGKSIDAAGRKVIQDAGYGEYFSHSFGHSLGLDIHETPNAAPNGDTIMPEFAVISAEPGIYLPGKFGVRIEDVLYLTPNGAENITNLDKRLIII